MPSAFTCIFRGLEIFIQILIPYFLGESILQDKL